MQNKTIKIIVQSGVVVDVKNIPDGYEVQIIDDDIEGHDVYNEEINYENKGSMDHRRWPKQAWQDARLVNWYTCQRM